MQTVKLKETYRIKREDGSYFIRYSRPRCIFGDKRYAYEFPTEQHAMNFLTGIHIPQGFVEIEFT